ncbi:MAG TPA: D-glycerate dehydrogenase [Syntrophales bacterium]|nr:D-glycerate dehydrogenase [Syntrophobacterales bacterium]HQL88962.1 D-glycerate dehydrogenase [Syntrophales bacterium]
MKPTILVSGHLTDDILSLLAQEYDVRANREDRPMGRADLLEAVAGADGFLSMITDAVDAELLDAAPRLRVVSNMAVGYNNIDVAAATARGIVVTNTPGILTEATAELAFALILAAARRVVDLDRRTRAGEWTCWAPLLFLSREVSGKTLGVVGLGRIGRAVARRARAFGMRVLYHSRSRLEAAEERDLGVEYAEKDELLATADFVSLHVPLSAETRHLIGRRELDLMKPTAYLINTSRGPVVDEAALVEALKARRIEGAGLDVYENEPMLTPGLAALDNAVLLPHVGSATVETRAKMARMAAENLLSALRGERPAHVVNPEVWPRRRG